MAESRLSKIRNSLIVNDEKFKNIKRSCSGVYPYYCEWEPICREPPNHRAPGFKSATCVTESRRRPFSRRRKSQHKSATCAIDWFRFAKTINLVPHRSQIRNLRHEIPAQAVLTPSQVTAQIRNLHHRLVPFRKTVNLMPHRPQIRNLRHGIPAEAILR